jgi:hypothetical protein
MESGGEIKNSYRKAMILNESNNIVKGANGYGASKDDGQKKYVKRDTNVNAFEQKPMGADAYMGAPQHEITEMSGEMGKDEEENILEEEQEETDQNTEEMSNMSLEDVPQILGNVSKIGEDIIVLSPLMKSRKKRSLLFDSDLDAATEPQVFAETTTSMPGDIYMDGMLVQHDVFFANPIYVPAPPELIEKYSKLDANSDEDDNSGSQEEFFTTPLPF